VDIEEYSGYGINIGKKRHGGMRLRFEHRVLNVEI
jgi:hypothetical protein